MTVAAEQQLDWGIVSEVKHGAPVLRNDPNVDRVLLSQEESLTAPICYFKESSLRDGTDKGPGFGPGGAGKHCR